MYGQNQANSAWTDRYVAISSKPVDSRPVPSAASSNVGLVTGPGADDGVRGEAGLGVGVGVAPADVPVDHLAPPGVGVVIGAAEREVAQGGELRFDPVQPRGVGGQEQQLAQHASLHRVVTRPPPLVRFLAAARTTGRLGGGY